MQCKNAQVWAIRKKKGVMEVIGWLARGKPRCAGIGVLRDERGDICFVSLVPKMGIKELIRVKEVAIIEAF